MGKHLATLLLFMLASLTALADVTVTGTVMDKAEQEPIIGASVRLKGKSTVGTSTDIDGKFTLTVPSDKSVIEISFVGMNPVEVKASSSPLYIEMETSATQLQEVVAIGMGNVDRRTFTGATTKINADDALLSGVSDISRSLSGRAAGVSVQNVSGTFGTAPKIRVRGATSIYGNSKPLWVVDGVPLEDNVELDANALSSGDPNTMIASAIAGLNADDIDQFQILKDGSATSIYGARAMAGVIVVTTKQGRSGRTSINYMGELTYRLKPSYRNYNISNSQEQMGIYKEMEEKGWLNFAALANSSSSGVYGTMYKLINTFDPATGQYALANTQSARNEYLRQAEMRNTDWFDLLFRNTVMQTHNVSVSGGTDKGRFYTSFSYMNDPGWTKASSVDRYTFTGKASYDLSKQLTFSMMTNDSYRNQKAPGTLSQDIDVVSGSVSRSFDINPFSYALNTSRTTDPNSTLTRNYADFNIFDELENNYITNEMVDVKFQGELDYKPTSYLSFKAIGAFRYSSTQQEHYVTDLSNQAMAYRAGISPENSTIRSLNPYLYTDPDDPNSLPISVLPNGGILYHNVFSIRQMDFRASANFNKTIAGRHLVTALAGFDAGKVDRHTESFQGWGMCYDNGNLPFFDWHLFKQMQEENAAYYSDSNTAARSLAYYLSASYVYDNRYVVNGTIRYEGSNKLGRSHQSRWLPTWNVSGAWNADSEEWFQNPVLATAKLRVGYSLNADAGPAFVSNALAVYYPSRPWRQDTEAYEQALRLSQLANSELTYEKKHEFNVGADLGFLHNRINLTFDWYKRNNFDLIGYIYTQGVGGEIGKWANVASMKSHGAEFTLSTQNIVNRDFTWTTDLTFSYFKNKITDLKSRSNVLELVKQGSGSFREGYPAGSLFSIPFVGLTEDGLPQVINENGEVTTSDINFQEWEKLDFLKYEGTIDPPFNGGFGNNLRYKGFNLNIFFTYAFGNKLRLDPVFSSSYSDLSAMPREFMDRWVAAGDEAHTNVPTIASRRQVYNNSNISYGYNAYNYSTERVAKGDYIRLKEIALSYELPSTVTRALRISSASVKLAATDLWLLYSDKKLHGQDPEFINSGGVATPNPKQFTFTLRFGL
ncbi:MAG: SusC/RagA family TonB-linked outer membrane protein [Muribaculaceae bacterium]|nr:SusC/RagA family TonB-linked outer membrane protein [Muribaculaceae bacterium]